jgi:putative phosphoribosyl transferase
MERFHDRTDAGRRLGVLLRNHALERPVVIGLPRGGVPVALEVARALGAPLDIRAVRKVGAPGNPELGAGAVAEGGGVVLNRAILSELGLSEMSLRGAIARAAEDAAGLGGRLRGSCPRLSLRDRTVVIVDDGIATGGTMRAAIAAVREEGARSIIAAAPVGPPETCDLVAREVDRLVCPERPASFHAVGLWYDDFPQLGDEVVARMLAAAQLERADTEPQVALPVATGVERELLRIPAAGVWLEGELESPRGAGGLVILAHGSGSSRQSTRNRFLARALRDGGFATLRLDLLSEEESARALADLDGPADAPDIPALASRLAAVIDWVRQAPRFAGLPTGLLGGSSGAAVALMAAAERPWDVWAVVSRGGRPDLAQGALAAVRSPTLFIVGGRDASVLSLNQDAMGRLTAPRRLSIVRNASHLFEEPGALEEVADLAVAWFAEHMPRDAPPPALRHQRGWASEAEVRGGMPWPESPEG